MGKRKKVTTRDIAEALGVSQSTVSMILSEKPRVSFSQDTVDKVRAMAEQMGYAEQVPDVSRKSKALANTIIAICPADIIPCCSIRSLNRRININILF